MLVVAPLAGLTAIFVAVMAVIAASGTTTSPTLIVAGLLSYLVVAALLGWFGVNIVSQLEKLGLTDSLSTLPNRRALQAEIRKLKENKTALAVALIDLDGFKMVNDLYGHAVGDALIKSISETLREVCGKEAKCFRLGGDEFAIYMAGPLAGTILEGICRKLLGRFGQPIAIDERRIAIGASVGLSETDGKDGLGASELLRRADVAMYVSKRGGKMRCTWFKGEFDRNIEAIRDMDEELRRALQEGEFVVRYQPLVDAKSREIVAVESLIRWERPDGKQISPTTFIPVAEESGLINAIGLFVLRQACSDAIAWDGIKLSVNISAAQLRNPEFPIQLGQILEETGFEPTLLELEITETCLVLDPVIAERSLDLIRGFGVNIALDDFGTGYASIGFLRQFRFEKLKLDRSLVVDSAEDESMRAMMLSSISMAQALKMDVTAEGVETEAQADLVRSAGCDQIQGWLYFKAMPAEDVTRHLAAPDPLKKAAAISIQRKVS
ncbi:EAL domain-containing protein [Altererythrobacter aquaemixtae]|uniref:EAL domain-containing protein n=2 Tax=Pontixanthobacter aquaemixtae TaxID=1958940 RepID=A0A844ZNS0_9SPHN|nr:EAL domain-containing protein [Pontixanthobacter aquaemixtae]